MIYFIQMIGGDAQIKIGYSKNPINRIRGIKTSNPYNLKLLGYIPGEFNDEKLIHKKFKHLRIDGEWFYPGDDLIKFLDSIGIFAYDKVSVKKRKYNNRVIYRTKTVEKKVFIEKKEVPIKQNIDYKRFSGFFRWCKDQGYAEY